MPKVRKNVTLDPDLVDWVEKQIENKRFASVSHAIEYALNELRKREET